MGDEVSRYQFSRLLHAITLSAVLSMLTACEPEFPAPDSRSFEVQEIDRVHIVAFAQKADVPTAREAAGLEAFLRSQNRRSAKAVVLEGGFPRTEARRGAVSKILVELGWPDPTFSEADSTTNHVRIVVTHEVVRANACRRETSLPGNWLPLGCANEYNLSRQIERPDDLVSGRRPEAGPADPAVDAYRRYMRENAPLDNGPEEGEATN